MRLLPAALLFLASTPVQPQALPSDWKTLLLNKVFFLRGMYEQDKLKFDATGQLIGKSEQTNPMRSAVQITKVEVKKDRLLLTGQRLVVYYTLSEIDGAPLGEPVQIEIAAPPTRDLQPIFDAIFTRKPTDLLPNTRPEWQFCIVDHKEPKLLPRLGPGTLPPAKTPADGPETDKVRVPVVLFAPSPNFDDSDVRNASGHAARVALRIDACGNPTNVHILTGISDSFDAKAVASVRAYRFKPAMAGDRPVAVMLNVVVQVN
jgi:hypothetical protein